MDHRLFEIDILAGLHGIDSGLLVPVIGRGDEDSIDILTGKDLAIVARGEEVGTPQLSGMGQATVVTVGDGDQLDAWNLQRSARVALTLDASANESELDDVIRRAWRRWR
jgi:hypothetical protein